MSFQSFFDLFLRGPKTRYTFWSQFHAKQEQQRSASGGQPVRHYGPFNKTQRGAQRRAARRFKHQHREATGYMAQVEVYNQAPHDDILQALLDWYAR